MSSLRSVLGTPPQVLADSPGGVLSAGVALQLGLIPWNPLTALSGQPWSVQVAGAWGEDVHVVLAGLTNTYSSYVTTREEYGAQRYEGASTIFGPHTLDAYIQARFFPCGGP